MSLIVSLLLCASAICLGLRTRQRPATNACRYKPPEGATKESVQRDWQTLKAAFSESSVRNLCERDPGAAGAGACASGLSKVIETLREDLQVHLEEQAGNMCRPPVSFEFGGRQTPQGLQIATIILNGQPARLTQCRDQTEDFDPIAEMEKFLDEDVKKLIDKSFQGDPRLKYMFLLPCKFTLNLSPSTRD